MEKFKTFLLSSKWVLDNKIDYYLHWVNQFYSFSFKKPGESVSKKEINNFLKHLEKTREDWQVKQASEAIQLFLYFDETGRRRRFKKNLDSEAQWQSAVLEMTETLRLKHST